MGRVDKVNLNSKHNHKPVGPRKLTVNEENEKMFIHPQLFPPAHVCVCVCCMNTAQWLVCVKSLTASLWLVRTGRQHHPGEGEKRTETQEGQARFTVGPAHVTSAVGGGREGGGGRRGGTAAVSFNEPLLLSSAFNLQRCPALLSVHTHTHVPVTHTV